MEAFIASLDLDVLNAWNEDLDRPSFGTRTEMMRWRLRDRDQRGRLRARPGYVLRVPAGFRDITEPALRAYYRGDDIAKA